MLNGGMKDLTEGMNGERTDRENRDGSEWRVCLVEEITQAKTILNMGLSLNKGEERTRD